MLFIGQLFNFLILMEAEQFVLKNFVKLFKKQLYIRKIPFPLESSDFVKLYFGKDKKRVVTYAEFSQFLHDFHNEYALVAFKAKDKDESGLISPEDFLDIMISIKSHL